MPRCQLARVSAAESARAPLHSQDARSRSSCSEAMSDRTTRRPRKAVGVVHKLLSPDARAPTSGPEGRRSRAKRTRWHAAASLAKREGRPIGLAQVGWRRPRGQTGPYPRRLPMLRPQVGQRGDAEQRIEPVASLVPPASGGSRNVRLRGRGTALRCHACLLIAPIRAEDDSTTDRNCYRFSEDRFDDARAELDPAASGGKPGSEQYSFPPVPRPVDGALCLVDGTLDLVLHVVGCVLRLVDGVVDVALDLALVLLVFALALEVTIALQGSEGLLHASGDLVGVLA